MSEPQAPTGEPQAASASEPNLSEGISLRDVLPPPFSAYIFLHNRPIRLDPVADDPGFVTVNLDAIQDFLPPYELAKVRAYLAKGTYASGDELTVTLDEEKYKGLFFSSVMHGDFVAASFQLFAQPKNLENPAFHLRARAWTGYLNGGVNWLHNLSSGELNVISREHNGLENVLQQKGVVLLNLSEHGTISDFFLDGLFLKIHGLNVNEFHEYCFPYKIAIVGKDGQLLDTGTLTLRSVSANDPVCDLAGRLSYYVTTKPTQSEEQISERKTYPGAHLLFLRDDAALEELIAKAKRGPVEDVSEEPPVGPDPATRSDVAIVLAG